MKKILITGSNGFIGKNLVEGLQNKYKLFYPSRENLDLTNTGDVEKFLNNEYFDVIIHTANTNNTRKSETTQYDSLNNNLRMFFNLEHCADLFGKMYYFGSGAEYDMNHYIPYMNEDYFDSYIPTDSYGFSKYVMSKSCKKNIYDLRLFGVFGKYEEWERRFISNAICRALLGMDITIHQNVFFDYLWIDDLRDIMTWFIECKPCHHHYNVCMGTKVDLFSLALIVRDILNIDCNITIEKQGLKSEYTGNNKRLLKEIGNYQFTDYKSAIEKLCMYYKENIDKIDREKLL